MLDEKDLKAIADIMDSKIKESENRMKTYVENTVSKDIKTVAEGIKTLNDRLPNVDKIVDLQDRVSLLETADEEQNKAIKKLQKAQ